ncbi:reverse transcriptase domain-containing protein [Tanacetum coccineum]|uniref:Reverse transcriptase domain-containing protein n=1 Tax=Tanacetum coccineum TaxID=301880 RepID=A0ABQ4ZRX8_9ASTR
MSATANTTPIVTTVTKTANKEKTQKERDKVNIKNFCEEHYEDILPIIMDKARRDKRKEVHTRLDFAESSEIGTRTKYKGPTGDRRRSRSTKRWREDESPSSRGSESSTSDTGHWKSRGKRRKTLEEDLAVPWSCEEVDPFTPRIHNFRSSRKTRMPNNVKTYDGTGDPEDQLKVFQASAQVERWSMPTWCHMFNSTLIGAARKKHVKDPVEIHNIKQKDGETIEEFIERFKVETGRMKGASECMKISRFMHGVNNPELTKRLNEHIPKTLEEMMTMTAAFIRGETTPASKKKVHTPWRLQDQPKRHNSERRTPKEIIAAESEKFKPLHPMVTPVDKRSSNKFCEFHNDKGHSTDECMQLKKQIEELVKAGKLSHFIKEIRGDSDKLKNRKKEAPAKEKAAAIYMIQSWNRVTRQKVTVSFAQKNEITFPPLSANKGTEGPLVIEAEIGGHAVHRMYVDGGSSMEILYEHCFNRLRPKIKSQMVPATTSLTGFSGETIWSLGQLRLLVTIGDAEHFTKAWMNFMIVRSPSPYNGIIGRPGIIEIQPVPSTAHGMLKFPVDGGVVTIRSIILRPNECATITTTSKDSIKKIEGSQKNVKVAIHHDFPDQEVALGGTLSIEGRTALCALLKRNLDIFAWQPSDMTGVPRQTAEHRLNIRDGYPPVRQKKRGQAPERAKAI